MPHERIRYLQKIVKKNLGMSPLVGILGHRQVGKTTLLGQLCKKYFVLDQKAEIDAAKSDPAHYIKSRAGHLVALDECQTAPEIFPELKEWVRKNKRPGQFILSGSVRFTSREAIREALTGRITYFELLPFSVTEMLKMPLSDTCVRALESTDLSHFNIPHATKSLTIIRDQIETSFERGGLPGICFIRDKKLREQKIDSQLRTILDRDLRLVQKILVSYSDIRIAVQSLARMQGEPLNYTQLKAETGLSTPTLKKIIYALEAVFILRTVKIEGSTMGHTIFFEDQAEWHLLAEINPSITQKLIHFCFVDLRTQFEYRLGTPTRTFQYKTRSGAIIPICFSNANGIIGILPTVHPDEPQRLTGSVKSFLSAYSNSKVLVVHMDNSLPIKYLNSRTILLPLASIV